MIRITKTEDLVNRITGLSGICPNGHRLNGNEAVCLNRNEVENVIKRN